MFFKHIDITVLYVGFFPLYQNKIKHQLLPYNILILVSQPSMWKEGQDYIKKYKCVHECNDKTKIENINYRYDEEQHDPDTNWSFSLLKFVLINYFVGDLELFCSI